MNTVQMQIWNKMQKNSHMEASQTGVVNGYEQAKVYCSLHFSEIKNKDTTLMKNNSKKC